MPRPKKYYSLTRPKLRQSWNKYNFFNMMNRKAVSEPQVGISNRTFFQQKWSAKAKTRAYHGEHIPEKKWKRMFSRRLMSATDMSPQYLAIHDGSEQAAGRGSGLVSNKISADLYSKAIRPAPGGVANRGQMSPNTSLLKAVDSITPYMQMTYAPLERRLDSAVFRALFASSIRQARQMVVHGGVKVNGKKMVYPAYQLNPGDMFQVDVDKVLYATGKPKEPESDRLNRTTEKRIVANTSDEAVRAMLREKKQNHIHWFEGLEKRGAVKETMKFPPRSTEISEKRLSYEMNNAKLNLMLRRVQSLLTEKPATLTAKNKRDIRIFRNSATQYLSQGEEGVAKSKDLMEAFAKQMESHLDHAKSLGRLRHWSPPEVYEEWKREQEEKKAAAKEPSTAPEAVEKREAFRDKKMDKNMGDLNEQQRTYAKGIMGTVSLTAQEMRNLGRLLKEADENPVEPDKPYMTPWEPRPYMSAFAFIPRYLEVNPNICAAVYLRHPVARKGVAEVPTPFSYLTNQLAHNWYLRRR